jgi:hypothetical protein
MLDLRLAVPSLIWDKDKKRRLLYGKAGCFRPKPYGMEYRTLSNAWLNPAIPHVRKFIFGETIRAVKDLFDNEEAWNVNIIGMSPEKIINHDDLDIQKDAINTAIRHQKVCVAPSAYKEAA